MNKLQYGDLSLNWSIMGECVNSKITKIPPPKTKGQVMGSYALRL